MAAGISFNIVLYFIPFSMLLVFLAGFFLNLENQGVQLLVARLQGFLPDVKFMPILTELRRLTAERSAFGLFGVLTLVYFSSKLFNMIQQAIHVAYDTPYQRNPVKDYVMSFLAVFAFSLVFFLFAGLDPLLRIVGQVLQEAGLGRGLRDVLESFMVQGVNLALGTGLFFLLYSLVPGKRVPTRYVFIGACSASCLWMAGRFLYGIYINHAGSYSLLYGTYGVVVLFLLWIYLSALLLVLGAELARVLYLLARLRQQGTPLKRLNTRLKSIDPTGT